MLEQLEQLKKQIQERIEKLQTVKELQGLRIEILSKKGFLLLLWKP